MKLLTCSIIVFATMSAPACAGELASAPKLDVTPTPRAAELYPDFPTDGIFPRIEDAESIPDPSTLRQPESLVNNLKAIQTGTLEERLQALKKKSIDDQVFIEGGKFLMGDFGYLQSNEKLPWSSAKSNKPLRKIRLSSYAMSKYKVTYAEFDLFTEANNAERIQTDMWFKPKRIPDAPAGVTWEQAKAYCTWLGTLTGQPFDLLSEAQWEFAARSRGYLIAWPTNDGTLRPNYNVPTSELRERLNGGSIYPIGKFPPNPLGLYDLAHNGLEWVDDWYSASYFAESSIATDPKGPPDGDLKVLRSWPPGDSFAGMSFDKRAFQPGTPAKRKVAGMMIGGPRPTRTVRCGSKITEQLR